MLFEQNGSNDHCLFLYFDNKEDLDNFLNGGILIAKDRKIIVNLVGSDKEVYER